jgi:TolA-binding protein
VTNCRILFILVLLALTAGRADAALFGGEKRAFELASRSFELQMWSRAEKEFAAFIKDHPKSEKLTDALLFQAQALFAQKKYQEVTLLLVAREGDAGKSADQFLYWIAQAEFESGNHRDAAKTFGRLARDFPFSARRLEAAVGEAAALVQLSEWQQVTNLLRRSDAPFRMAASASKGSESASRGFLLLGEAQLALKNYFDAAAALNLAAPGAKGELEWRRRLLLCRAMAEGGRTEEAAKETLGLIETAESVRQPELIAESVVYRADILERLGQAGDAIAALRRNLTNSPDARQREALTRITRLALENNQLDIATKSLEQYLEAGNAPAADLAWLTLGEVRLKQHVAQSANSLTNDATTNFLALATNCFQRVVAATPPSKLAGKAQLNLGWCFWIEKNMAESGAAFEAAVKRLPESEDLAVAKFKLADVMFAQTNFSGALENYQAALRLATNWPSVSAALSAPASYQALRASLELTNAAGAESAMRGILAADAAGGSADGAVLLVAQAYVDAKQPAAAQRMFTEFVQRFPESALRPEAELLVARMREEQADWPNAAAAYETWLTQFPTNLLRPHVEFQRAFSAARSGDETKALRLFTNFVAQFPTNELAARAQWWVADHFYQREEFALAELNYKQLFQNWKTSPLAYEARMMAGRAAVARSAPRADAVDYFASITSDTNCPPELRAQALFAYGGVLMKPDATETNRTESLNDAIKVFNVIVREDDRTNEVAALAWGEIGNCYLQLAVSDAAYYAAASNAYLASFSIPAASVATRGQSRVGLAVVLEKQAAVLSNGERITLLRAARDLNLDVYFGKHLTDGETVDAFWRKKAASDAARLSESLGEWEQAIRLYRDMVREGLMTADALEKKIATAERQQANGKAGRG